MIIKSLDDLQVYQRALETADAVSAILERPCWLKDPELRSQMYECSDRIPSNISEGFGQGTDRHCAHFQRIARGSANEMCTHFRRARARCFITADECQDLSGRYVIIGKMLTNWLKQLVKENRPRRG